MKIIIPLLLAVLTAATAKAQFNDRDGHLVISWQAPDYGNPLDHYIWSYDINGTTDSLTGTSAANATADSTVTLSDVGDWAIFTIRAISVVGDTSEAVVSDTAYYNTGDGIGPPRGVTWIQGP